MKTKVKASGFFIVEILIVLAIVAILVTALLPNLSLYTSRAKYADVLTTANAIKPAVELCILQTATPGGAAPSNCGSGNNGVPLDTTSNYGANVAGFTTIGNGTITATGNGGSLAGVTYVLIPTYNGSGTINWTSAGTCKASGLC